jgi:hypothetical protein
MCLLQEKRESLTNEADGPKEPSRENKPYIPTKMHWLSKFVFILSGGRSVTGG